MSASLRYQRAARAWHDAAVPVADVDPMRDARVVAALGRAISQVPARSARRRMRRAMVTVALAAMAALAAVALVRLRTTAAPAAARAATLQAESIAALVLRRGTTRFADPSSEFRLEPGDEVSVASGGRAHVRLTSGAWVEISPETRLRIAGADRDDVIELTHGAVALRVPKLASPHTLSVIAPDASVIVHGTEFSVSVAGVRPTPTRTSVHVTEGEVAVLFSTGHVILRSGQSWTSGTESREADRPPLSPAGGSAPSHVVLPPDALKTRSPARASKEKGDDALAIQNRLYSAALSARDRGDDETAVSLLSELLERYPNSPLADEARRVRARASTQARERH